MESTDSSGGSQQPNLPPGFRFHPTDEELVIHYLKKKATSSPLPVAIIAEVDLYKFDPWELPGKATFGEQEWYFFSPRDRKYPNGARPNRAATSGYWKATGTDKPVLTAGGTQKVGVKKALVFYGGKPPKGIKTNWIMHEYRLVENKVSNKPPGCDLANKKNSLRLDDWVLCRIYKKNNTGRSPSSIDHHDKDDSSSMDEMMMMGHVPPSIMVGSQQNFSQMMIPHQNSNLFDGINNNNSNNSNGGCAADSISNMDYCLKRTLSSVNWTPDDDVGAGMSKRFYGDVLSRSESNVSNDGGGGGGGVGSIERTCNHGNSNSFATLLSQLPVQTPPLPQSQQGIMGSLGDGIFRSSPYSLPAGLNWYS